MTNNASYPKPSPTLASVTTAIDDFSTAIDNAADGGITLTIIKNQKRAALGAVLRKLASYVHVACNGDLAALTSSGFPVWKPRRTPVGVLPAPATPVLSLGSRTGELNASTPPIANASVYSGASRLPPRRMSMCWNSRRRPRATPSRASHRGRSTSWM